MPTYTRTSLLSHALVGYEQRKAEITEAIARIRATMDGEAPTITTAPAKPVQHRAPRRKHTLSPAVRKRMSMLMKRRWAKAKRGGKKSLR